MVLNGLVVLLADLTDRQREYAERADTRERVECKVNIHGAAISNWVYEESMRLYRLVCTRMRERHARYSAWGQSSTKCSPEEVNRALSLCVYLYIISRDSWRGNGRSTLQAAYIYASYVSLSHDLYLCALYVASHTRNLQGIATTDAYTSILLLKNIA